MPIVDPRTGAPLSSGTADSPTQGSNTQKSYSIDVDLKNFQQVVLEGSMKGAVLLQSWDPQSEACQQLNATLETLANEYHGGFTLARLDAKAYPQITSQLGITSVPDVKLIVQGQLYDQFQGALPESQIRQWLGQYVEAPKDAGAPLTEQAKQAQSAGHYEQARQIYKQLMEAEPNVADHPLGIAETYASESNTDEAQAWLNSLPPDQQSEPRAKALKTRLQFAKEAPSHEEVKALGDRQDSEAQFKRALRAIAEGQYEGGLEALIQLMKSDRHYDDDAPRKTLLRVFEALGNDDPLTIAYRRKMFALLY